MLPRIVAACVLSITFFVSVHAETLEHKESGLQFDIPEGWKTEQQEDLLVANNEDDDVVML